MPEVYRYFGVIHPNSEVKEGDWTLEFRCFPDNCVYKRRKDNRIVKYVVGDVKLLKALPLVYTGESYFMNLVLDMAVTLDSDAYMEFRIGLPIAVQITSEKEIIITDDRGTVRKETVTSVIDKIPLTTVKYSIYGDITRGFLTRFYKARLGSWSFITEIPLNIKVYNDGGRAYTIRRIVFPSTLIELFYKEGSPHVVASPLKIVIEKKYAEIKREEFEPPEGFVKVPGSGLTRKWIAIFGLS